ncbi:hypothetical protein [uncultured Propionivibrio sp.]|uniref:hypothetical protein n=1 Tax=uncultured Propionivibrio sp. TaxID=426737 RepID=UPI0029C09E6D|nr:hypothetical protein [uncultured Propionivibrio sp.]
MIFQITSRDPIAEIAKQLPAEYLVHANEIAHYGQDATIPERDVSILVLRLLLRQFPHHHCVRREVNLSDQAWGKANESPKVFCDIAIFWPWVEPNAPIEKRIAAPLEIKLATSTFREVIVDIMRLTALSERLQLPSYFLLIGSDKDFESLLGNQLGRVVRNAKRPTNVKRKDLLDLLSVQGNNEAECNEESTSRKYTRYANVVKSLNESASFKITRVHNEIFRGIRLGIWEVVHSALQTPDRGRFSFSISPVKGETSDK